MLKRYYAELHLLLTAVQFFTRIPVPHWVGHAAIRLDQAVRYFPVVGALTGCLVWLILWLSALVLPLEMAVLFCMVASVLITGAFHEDGLSDYADGMGGGYTREQILDIMKDSRVGAYGVISLILVFMLKFEALMLLSKAHAVTGMAVVLVAAHVLSRVMPVFIMQFLPYVREEATARARPVARQPGWISWVAVGGAGVGVIGLTWCSGFSLFNIIIALLLALAVPVLLARQMRQKIGGYTGDALGAVQQLSEMAIYIGLLCGS